MVCIDNPIVLFDGQGGDILEKILGKVPVTHDGVDVGNQAGAVLHETFYRCCLVNTHSFHSLSTNQTAETSYPLIHGEVA